MLPDWDFRPSPEKVLTLAEGRLKHSRPILVSTLNPLKKQLQWATLLIRPWRTTVLFSWRLHSCERIKWFSFLNFWKSQDSSIWLKLPIINCYCLCVDVIFMQYCDSIIAWNLSTNDLQGDHCDTVSTKCYLPRDYGIPHGNWIFTPTTLVAASDNEFPKGILW